MTSVNIDSRKLNVTKMSSPGPNNRHQSNPTILMATSIDRLKSETVIAGKPIKSTNSPANLRKQPRIPNEPKMLETNSPKPEVRTKISVGPRLNQSESFDKDTIYAVSRNRVKELNEKIRVSSPKQVSSLKRNIKKKKEPEKCISEAGIFEKLNSRMEENKSIENYADEMKTAFSSYLVPSDAEMMSGEIGYSSEIMRIIHGDKTEVSRSEPILNCMPEKVISSLQDSIQSKKNYDYLIPITKIPLSKGDSTISNRNSTNSLDQGLSKIENYKKQNTSTKSLDIFLASDDPRKTTNFVQDFELLLQRQMDLDKEALSSLSNLDVTATRTISRFPRSDVVHLIWNLLLNLKCTSKPFFSTEESKEICYLISSGSTDEAKLALLIKNLVLRLDRKILLDVKMYTGHIKSANRAIAKLLVKGIANLLGPLFFDSFIKVPSPKYFAPMLQLGVSVNWDISTGDTEIDFSLRPQEPEPIMNMSTLKFPETTIQLSSPKPPKQSLSIFVSDIRAASAEYKSAHSLNIIDTGMETLNELKLTLDFIKETDLQNLLFDSELPLAWHGVAIDYLVRYWDFIFAPFNSNVKIN